MPLNPEIKLRTCCCGMQVCQRAAAGHVRAKRLASQLLVMLRCSRHLCAAACYPCPEAALAARLAEGEGRLEAALQLQM